MWPPLVPWAVTGGVAARLVDLAASAGRDDQARVKDRGFVDAGRKAAVLRSEYIQVGDSRVSAAVAARAGA
jgi:hypothetical protein